MKIDRAGEQPGFAGVPSEFRVVGDDSTIRMYALNQSGGANSGTLSFVFDDTGVSPINITDWMHLQHAKLVVDGSNYTGGAATFTLLDSTNLSTLLDPAKIVVRGFGQRGMKATVVQDQAAGADWVQVIVKPLVPLTEYVSPGTIAW